MVVIDGDVIGEFCWVLVLVVDDDEDGRGVGGRCGSIGSSDEPGFMPIFVGFKCMGFVVVVVVNEGGGGGSNGCSCCFVKCKSRSRSSPSMSISMSSMVLRVWIGYTVNFISAF